MSFAALCCIAPTSYASPVADLLGAATSPHPFTAMVHADGAEAAYANPALLVGQPATLTAGVVLRADDLSITLAPRPAGVDVPDTLYDLRELLPDGTTRRLTARPLPTSALASARADTHEGGTHAYLELGLVQPLLDGRLAFALAALLPTDALQRQSPFFVDEREQYFSNRLHFTFGGDRLTSQALTFALAGRPLPWLSLGAGVTLGMRSTATTDVYIGDSAFQETALINADVHVEPLLTPHFGLTLTPLPELSLALTAHLASTNPTTGASAVQFWTYPYPDDTHAIVQRFRFDYAALPLRLAAGARWASSTVAPLRWSAAATARYARWSAWPDRHGERPTRPFSDTLAVALGGDLTVTDHTVALDASFTPTPVPTQDGRSNHVDNDTLGLSAGYTFRHALGEHTLRWGLTLTLWHLLPRTTTKSDTAADPVFDELPTAINIKTDELASESAGLQTNNPGYPGFTSGGWRFAAGLRVTLTL
ncbi:MAG: hypothetical protein EP329_08235 [Deltaproteobacteria bacterium]|nr:MAG: hypothetical protein EP329_08235 [Deltaproteobacteria bacterium]